MVWDVLTFGFNMFFLFLDIIANTSTGLTYPTLRKENHRPKSAEW